MTETLKENLYTKIPLKFNSDGKFKIMMMSDIQESLDFNPLTLKGINGVLDMEKPDLVILGGDNCDVYQINNEQEMKQYLDIMTEPFERRHIPWAHLWGNHDHAPNIDEARQQAMYMSYDHCVSKTASNVSGQSNFVLPIYASTGDKIKFNVWGLDSGNMIYELEKDMFGKEVGLYDQFLNITPECHMKALFGIPTFDRLVWYYNSSIELEKYNGEKINALMTTHVTIWEMFNVIHSTEHCKTEGDFPENFGCGFLNSGLYAAMFHRQDVRAICSGHTHENDVKGTYGNIDICCDGSIGYTAYGDNNRRGARIFEIDESNTQNVKTRMVYCRDIK